MNNVSGQSSHDAVIEQARLYLEKNGLDDKLPVHEVFYRSEISDEMRAKMEEDLGRTLDEDELRLMGQHNKSGWVVQFVFEECEAGATPQGPRVLLDDDGSVSHYRPM